jgi:hypothetical protein
MVKVINISVENRLILEKRDMNVYHHASRSAHMISYNNSITVPLRADIEEDYLHISIVSGPGHLKNRSVVNLPSWLDFEFLSEGKITVNHANDRTLLIIPPGFPSWQLRMTRSISGRPNPPPDRVTIGDDQTEHWR